MQSSLNISESLPCLLTSILKNFSYESFAGSIKQRWEVLKEKEIQRNKVRNTIGKKENTCTDSSFRKWHKIQWLKWYLDVYCSTTIMYVLLFDTFQSFQKFLSRWKEMEIQWHKIHSTTTKFLTTHLGSWVLITLFLSTYGCKNN